MDKKSIDALLERIHTTIPIIDVVGKRIILDQNGMGLCPFHHETKPSFSVHPERPFFKCFGCGAGGDIIEFIKLFHNISFMETIKMLATEYGIPISEVSPQDQQVLDEQRKLDEIRAEAVQFYQRSLTPIAIEYLTKSRGLTPDTIAKSQLGYASGSLVAHLLNDCKFPQDLCLKSGLLKLSKNGLPKDYFYDRIVFPNLKNGRVVHFTARSMADVEPKYLHIPGPIEHLFNEDALRSKEVYLMEGICDCLYAVQSGLPAVGIYGTSVFGKTFVQRFSRCETIYICLDGDPPGRKAALVVASLLPQMATRIVHLPDGSDPDEFIKEHGVEGFQKLVASAKPLVETLLEGIPEDMPKPELVQRLKPVIEVLSRMESVQVEAYLNHAIKDRFSLTARDVSAYRMLLSHTEENSSSGVDDGNASDDLPQAKYTALFDGLIDIVELDGNPVFLVQAEDNLSMVAQVERNGELFTPPPIEQIPWLLVQGGDVLRNYQDHSPSSDSNLFDDLVSYHKDISKLPDDTFYDLLAAWVIATYLLEHVDYFPIVCLYAVPERGKSRTGKGMTYVAWRGIHVESLRDPYIVRVAAYFRAAIFFDVMDIIKKAEHVGSEDILLHRFEKGATVPRVFPDRGTFKDIVYYKIFGPTIIGTNEAINPILATRSITINMPEASKRFENDVRPDMALPLRARLLAFRAKHINGPLPEVSKPAHGRLGDILKVIRQIIRLVKPEREEAFMALVERLETKRLDEKADSLEAEILKTIINLKDHVLNRMLAIKSIVEALNVGRSDRMKLSPQRIGRKLNELGFEKGRLGHGESAILYNESFIETLVSRYGLDLTSVTPDRSDRSDGDR